MPNEVSSIGLHKLIQQLGCQSPTQSLCSWPTEMGSPGQKLTQQAHELNLARQGAEHHHPMTTATSRPVRIFIREDGSLLGITRARSVHC